MRSWLSRLWRYLRRLLVNGDEDTPPPAVDGRPAPDEQIGRELRQFFLELLKDHNLKRLQSPDAWGLWRSTLRCAASRSVVSAP